MGLFSRISDLFKANVNDAVDKAEDPEKMVKLMVQEMQEAVVKSTSGLAKAMGHQKKLEKQYKQYQQKTEEMAQNAQKALEAGNEDLARQALTKKNKLQQQAEQYKEMYQNASAQVDKLKQDVERAKAKLEEARMKEQMLISRSQNAKAQKDLAKTTSSVGENSFAKFDKLEEKITSMEAEAEAYSELSGEDQSFDEQMRQLETESSVDDELASMKAKLNDGNQSASSNQ